MVQTTSGKRSLDDVDEILLTPHRFEAFDEPWKVYYNKGDQNWEDKWGLMDPGRNLKPGLQIPSCGGKTV